MPKMHQNTFGGRAPLPGPTGRAHALHRPSSCNGGLFNGREGREGPTSKEGGREGREERGDGNEEEGNPPKVKVSRRNAVGELEKRL